jgi:type II secretory ATPase GspE/PulE/Tfp pilus assembly ATPase PilB-like protein
LLDMGVEPFLAASSIIAVMAQRLVRRICPDCREVCQPSSEAVETMARETDGQVPDRFYRGAGCSACRFTGYLDRCGIFELLVVNDEIRQLVLQHASASQIKQAAIRQGMISLRQDGWEKVYSGATTLDEVLRVTSGYEAIV